MSCHPPSLVKCWLFNNHVCMAEGFSAPSGDKRTRGSKLRLTGDHCRTAEMEPLLPLHMLGTPASKMKNAILCLLNKFF